MKKILKLAAVSSLAFALAACHSAQNQNTNPSAANNGKAQTYGMGQKGGLTGNEADGGQYGSRYMNPMTAPAHQVYYFGFDQSTVKASDIDAIKIQSKYLLDHPQAKVRLEGNTDDLGSHEYNIGLGARRNKAVAYIMKQYGVKPRQIDMVSYGKEHPAVSGDSEEARSLNRRVELIYVQK